MYKVKTYDYNNSASFSVNKFANPGTTYTGANVPPLVQNPIVSRDNNNKNKNADENIYPNNVVFENSTIY
jgi:hypothetical protein